MMDDYIESHSREMLKLVLLGIWFAWQSCPTVIALLLYLLMKRIKLSCWWMFVPGLIVFALDAFFEARFSGHSTKQFFVHAFHANILFWVNLIHTRSAPNAEYIYLLTLPLLLSSLLSIIDLLVNNPHEKIMTDLRQGKLVESKEVDDCVLNKALKNLCEDQYDGTVLGVSKYTGQCVFLPDNHLNQVALVLGTTGAGKTITLKRFYQRAIKKGYPLMIVDGKPDADNIAWLKNFAEKHHRTFYGFNCADHLHYDPLAHGGYTELKDKIICLKDEWENDYYRSIAEDYLQTTFEVLLQSGESIDLKKVVSCLTYKELVKAVCQLDDIELSERVHSLQSYEMKDITGLQAHLNILIHSELGKSFIKNDKTFSLSDVINNNAVVYFALPALRFPSFSKVLGKLVINDIKAVVDRIQTKAIPIFTIFDEFSVFAGEQVLNLVNMGRGKGVHAIFGTQGLADLDRVDASFKSQVLNCVNTLICHRLNDQESAETISNWIGTRDTFTVTAQLNMKESSAGLGSVKRDKEFIVHPDQIKQGLRTGNVFFITKVANFYYDKVVVKLCDI